MSTSKSAGQSDDPLHMGAKNDDACVSREDIGGVSVMIVENENLYPKQSQEIGRIIKLAIRDSKQPKILVDLTKVQFASSAFIGQLVDLHQFAREKSGDLKVCVTGEHVAYTMKLVKLNKVMEIGGDKVKLLDSF